MALVIENLLPSEKPGIERAAKWHDDYAKILREAVAKRIEYNYPHGGQLAEAEEHESCAFWLRQSLKEAK